MAYLNSGTGIGRGGQWKGQSGNWCTYIWDGHSFFPTFSTNGIDYDDWDHWVVGTPSVYSPKTQFYLDDYWPGNECALFFLSIGTYEGESGYVYLDFYDPSGRIYFSATWFFPSRPYDASWWVWAGVGVGKDFFDGRPDEVCVNGTHGVSFDALDLGISPRSYVWEAHNLDLSKFNPVASNYSQTGNLWVEGEYLYFIDGMMGKKIRIKHSGHNLGDVGLANAGYIWVPASAERRLHYIDHNGIHRKTHVGDIYATYDYWEFFGGDINVGSSNAGYIWNYGGWAFLYFVDGDGYWVRLGAGYVYGDGM